MTRTLYLTPKPRPALSAGTVARLQDLNNRIVEQQALADLYRSIGDRRGQRRAKAIAAQLADEAVQLRAGTKRRRVA